MGQIKLIKQSYSEAAKSVEVEYNLELIGIVSGSVIYSTATGKSPFSQEAISEVNEQMKKQAAELGATYVFGIEYQGLRREFPASEGGATFGYGDAYKPLR